MWAHLKVPHRGLLRASVHREASYLNRTLPNAQALEAGIGPPDPEILPEDMERESLCPKDLDFMNPAFLALAKEFKRFVA